VSPDFETAVQLVMAVVAFVVLYLSLFSDSV
jgi:hypothetical protein